MSFEWKSFLRQHHIEFVEGDVRHQTKGNIGIRCPFCGASDQGYHMGISLEGRGWRCWRDPQHHKGKSPARLIATLIGCSMQEALAIAGFSRNIPSNLLGEVQALLNPTAKSEPTRTLDMPREFFKFGRSPSVERPFRTYLKARTQGFTQAVMLDFADDFDLRWTMSGAYGYRIIFPIYENRKLVTWTGRHIGNSEIRYKTLSDDPEKAKREGYQPAVAPITNFLLWYDALEGAQANDTLVICEGPFDAWRVRTLGEPFGIMATCLFTATASSRQVELLHAVMPRYKRRILLLDAKTLSVAMELRARLASLSVTFSGLPDGIKDPGVLPDYSTLLHCVGLQA